MRKVRIRLPAVAGGFGSLFNSSGLALSLHANFEISFRQNDEIIVDAYGEGAGRYPTGLRHPTVVGMSRMFQILEYAPQGFHVRVNNEIPFDAGLGAEAIAMVAGMAAANYLSPQPLDRKALVQLIGQNISHPELGITSLLGGLTNVAVTLDRVFTRTYKIENYRVIIAVPLHEPAYPPPALPERLPSQEALNNIQRIPILIDALRTGDMRDAEYLLRDALLDPYYREHIPGYEHVMEIARLAGAYGIGVSGGGPALVVFGGRNIDRIAEAIEVAYNNLGINTWVRVTSVDTQGIVVSMVQSG